MRTEYEVSYQGVGPSHDAAAPMGSTLPDGVAFGGWGWVAPGEGRMLIASGKAPDAAIISGANRHKYHKRPIIPFMNMQPPEVLFSKETASEALSAPAPAAQPAAKHSGVQSMYREGAAQTDPYTPDFVIKEGDDPELLKIASMTFANGQLPAGLREVQMIERARQKRAFEASLPPITDEVSLALRRKMLSEQEMREWKVREVEMLAEQEERLETFDRELRSDAEALDQAWEERVELQRQKKLTEKDAQISLIQRRRIKALRKLSEARKIAELNPTDKRDVVSEYADHGSAVYAPLARQGRSLTTDKMADQYSTRPVQLESFHGLVELEQSLPRSAFEVSISKPKKGKAVGLQSRAAQKLRDTLDSTNAALRLAKQAKPSQREEREAMLANYRDAKPVERPPTPEAAPPEGEEEVQAATILLQRLLRGRAVQNMMYQGKERRLDLIEELRSEEGGAEDATAALAQAGADAVAGVGGSIIGSVLGVALDTMAKELRAFKEERRVAEIMDRAEKQRCTREAEESGRRAVELAARAEAQEMFRQIMRIHASSAESYLSEVMDEAVAESSLAVAAEDAQRRKAEMGASLGQGGNALLIASGLVDNFVFPEVLRQMERRKAEADGWKYAAAAQRCISDAVDEVAEKQGVSVHGRQAVA
jgi:hypothetical protein